MTDYFILAEQLDPRLCSLDTAPDDFRRQGWRVSKGIAMEHRHPTGVALRMSDDHRGLQVPDLVHNTLALCVVSDRLKALFEAEAAARIEFLPVAIQNHKGRVAAENYFLANVLDHCDCIDLQRSDVDRHSGEPGMLSGLHRLHVTASAIPADARLFRLKAMPEAILVRDDLRRAMETAGITGARFVAMGERHSIF